MSDEAISEEFPPPERLSQRAADAWREIVALHGKRAGRIVGPELEVYCDAIGAAREARSRIDAEGMIIADPRGTPIHHPALSIATAAERTIERLAPRFQARVDRGEQGYLVRKTRESVRAAGLHEKAEYSGMIASAVTLALIIDRAQEEGYDALRRAAFGPIPTYIKTIKDLGLSPDVSVVSALADVEDSGGSVVDPGEWMKKRQGA